MWESFFYTQLNTTNYTVLFAGLFLAFSFLYFGLALTTNKLLKLTQKKGWTTPINLNPLYPGQIRFEIKQSLFSILIFSLYGVLTVFCYRIELIEIDIAITYNTLVHVLVLMLWNELHFYSVHKLMHTRWFIRFHRVHHKSFVVTPFSAYSFHGVEALALGSVMILPLLVMEMQLLAFVIFPVIHLFFNILGHSNATLTRPPACFKKIAFSTDHNRHHTAYKSNFGFLAKLFDRLFKTQFKPR